MRRMERRRMVGKVICKLCKTKQPKAMERRNIQVKRRTVADHQARSKNNSQKLQKYSSAHKRGLEKYS